MEHWESGMVYLKINDDILPVEPHKGYEVFYSSYETISKTEAGTTTRDMIRSSIPSIAVNFECNQEMLQNMHRYRDALQLDVYFYDPYKIFNHNLMFVTGYKEKLLGDVKGGIWSVSFTLEDLESV